MYHIILSYDFDILFRYMYREQMLTTVTYSSTEYPVTIHKADARLTRWSIDLSGTESRDALRLDALSDMVGLFVISENADIVHGFTAITLAVDCHIDTVAAGIVHTIVKIAVRDIVSYST